ncbi:MAG: type II 3-dehydroquinate dehydratase [Anaerovoracaceae bacterium]|nr:type II 3-dehydroquinate dehydratase [Clostridiales bacterium]
MKIYIINGPNLNLLGLREPEIYGHRTYEDLISYLLKEAEALGAELMCFQSNHEGKLIDIIQEAGENAEGIVINPAAYTHTSIAIYDALKAVNLPAVEVHLTDPSKREPFRKVSYVKDACVLSVLGRGFQGYKDAVKYLVENYGCQS